MSHDHHHDHTQTRHSHHHGHNHIGHDHIKRRGNLLFAACLNLGFTIIELIGGILTNSIAVLSDALHDLGDSLTLFAAYFAEGQAKRGADRKRTFGYARISLFSALVSATILLVGSIYILIEAIARLFQPEPVLAGWVAGLAVFGLATNILAYKKLHGGHSANEKVLSWHLLEDVFGWVAVLIGAVVMHFTGWFIIDPILTIAFTLLIIFGVVHNLKEVINLFMEGVPAGIDTEKIKKDIGMFTGIKSIHDIHVWSLDGSTAMLTAHVELELDSGLNQNEIYNQIKNYLKDLSITHTTIEFESKGVMDCHGNQCD